MNPELFRIGPLSFHSYGFCIAAGVLFSLFLMGRHARRLGFPPPEKIFDLVFMVVFSGLLGARLFYVVQEWSWYREHPLEIFQVWQGGLVYFGGVFLSLLAVLIYVRRKRLPVLRTFDFLIVYIPLVHAFGRLGCFLNGCCYGGPCDFPWAVQFPSLPVPVHPTQLYEVVFNLILFGFLANQDLRQRTPGTLTVLYLILYPAGRFSLEFLRGDQTILFASLTLQQIMSLVFIGFGALLYGILRYRRR